MPAVFTLSANPKNSIQYAKQSSNQTIERGDFRSHQSRENIFPKDKHKRYQNRRLSALFGKFMSIRNAGRNQEFNSLNLLINETKTKLYLLC